MNRILIINPFGIGDVLFSTPLLKAIKKRYPSCEITYICNRRTQGILKYNPNISRIYIFEKDDYRKIWQKSKPRFMKEAANFIIRLRRDKYDAAIDMTLGHMASLLLLLFARIRVRIGFNYRDRGRFLTHRIDIEGFDKKHVVEYYFELGKPLHVETDDKDMQLVIGAEDAAWARTFLKENGICDSDRLCGIIPGCGASWGIDADYRRWSPWKFAEVADYAAKRYGYRILIFGEKKEMHLCLKVEGEMKSKPVQLCDKTTLAQFAALLSRCDLVITNDGGPLHMTVALKRRTISIFGPVDERIYGPYPQSRLHITIVSNEPCRPCYRYFKYQRCNTFNCLKNIKPEGAERALDEMMRRA